MATHPPRPCPLVKARADAPVLFLSFWFVFAHSLEALCACRGAIVVLGHEASQDCCIVLQGDIDGFATVAPPSSRSLSI